MATVTPAIVTTTLIFDTLLHVVSCATPHCLFTRPASSTMVPVASSTMHLLHRLQGPYVLASLVSPVAPSTEYSTRAAHLL